MTQTTVPFIVEPSMTTVYVAGHNGMVGSAMCRRLVTKGYRLVLPEKRVDLTDQKATLDLVEKLQPDWIFDAAARVGGIAANSNYPAQFIYENLMVQSNLMHAAYVTGVKKFMFLGSSCIYPRLAPQPLREDYLLSGPLEPTNKPYAVAKIAGIVMAQSYRKQYGMNCISVMPTNLYGPGDNFNLEDSHVIPAILRKTHEAKMSQSGFVEIWGSGNSLREFLHVDDMADACVFLMENYDSGEPINIGTGEDVSIRELAMMIKEVVGFKGQIKFNTSMPDGTPRKLLDVSKLTGLGWKPAIGLRDGLARTYEWYLKNQDCLRK